MSRAIRADGLRQILTNLVANAVKFTAHGTVTVRLHLAAADAEPTNADTGLPGSATLAFVAVLPSDELRCRNSGQLPDVMFRSV